MFFVFWLGLKLAKDQDGFPTTDGPAPGLEIRTGFVHKLSASVKADWIIICTGDRATRKHCNKTNMWRESKDDGGHANEIH